MKWIGLFGVISLVVLVLVVVGIVWLITRAGNGRSSAPGQDGACEALREVRTGVEKMGDRLEALETTLQDQERKG